MKYTEFGSLESNWIINLFNFQYKAREQWTATAHFMWKTEASRRHEFVACTFMNI